MLSVCTFVKGNEWYATGGTRVPAKSVGGRRRSQTVAVISARNRDPALCYETRRRDDSEERYSNKLDVSSGTPLQDDL